MNVPTIVAPSSSGSDCVIVLNLPAVSASLHFRAYAEPMGRDSLLAWAVSRLRGALPDVSGIYVLSADRAEAHRVERALMNGSHVSTYPASSRGRLHDLAELIRETGKARLLTVDLTAALLPRELFARLVRHHLARGHQATSMVGLPCATPPVLIEAELLSALVEGFRELPPAMMPQDLAVALTALDRATATGGEGTVGRVGRLFALTADEQARRGWPYMLRLRERDDVEILRRVLERCSGNPVRPETAAVEPLDQLSVAAREYQEERLANLRQRSHALRSKRSTVRRVLYVQSPSAFTGVEQVLVHLADAIRRGLDRPFEPVGMIALPGVLTDRLAAVGIDVHIAHRDFSRESVEHYLYSRHILRTIEPDIVHAHAFVGMPFSCAVAESGLPFIQHVHVATDSGIGRLENQIMVASAVVAVSDFVKQRLMRLGTDPNKLHVIRNGINRPKSEQICRSSAAREGVARVLTRQACGIPENAPVVLMPGRFATNKRHDVAIDAFVQLRARLPEARLVMAGEAFPADRPVVQGVDAKMDGFHIHDHVHRLGFWRDMAALYAAADVVLLPSEDDPLPLIVLEAMAAGVPVVAARSGGTPEMIEHGASGLLVEPGDADAFAAALIQMLTEDEQRAKLAAGGIGRCRAEFSLSRFVNDVARLYEEVLASERTTVDASTLA